MQNQVNEQNDKPKNLLTEQDFKVEDTDDFDFSDDSNSNILCDECMPLGYCKMGIEGRITKEEAEENFINDILDPIDVSEDINFEIEKSSENSEALTQQGKHTGRGARRETPTH